MLDRPSPYDALIDEEIWRFIERTGEFYPPETAAYGVEDQRRIYDEMCAAFNAGRPDHVEINDHTIAAAGLRIPVRDYRRENQSGTAHVVYLHGGGFILGGLDSHDDVCAEICERTGFRVTSVDYRLAPEHPFPAPFEDALAAYVAIAANSERPVVLCGDSAGATLCAAVSMETCSAAFKPAGQVLIYPSLGGNRSMPSYIEHANAPMLTTDDMAVYERMLFGGGRPADDRANLLQSGRFEGLPPTVIITAQCDPLASDGPAYANAIRSKGGKALCIEEAGMVHGYLRARNMSSRAAASFSRIITALDALGHGKWPDDLQTVP